MAPKWWQWCLAPSPRDTYVALQRKMSGGVVAVDRKWRLEGPEGVQVRGNMIMHAFRRVQEFKGSNQTGRVKEGGGFK